MKYNQKQELVDFIRIEIKNLERAIKRANLNNQFAKADYYEGMRDAYLSGLDKLLSENQNL